MPGAERHRDGIGAAADGLRQRHEIADGALHDLHLQVRYQEVLPSAVRSVAVDAQAGVLRRAHAWTERARSELEFQNRLVVAVALLRDQAAPAVPSHPQQSVLNAINLVRVGRTRVLEPRIK